MEINWHKSCAYWVSKNTLKLGWLNSYNWAWAEETDITKLLGTPFDFNLHTHDVDKFLIKKIAKKLEYWATMKLSLAGRAIIINQVLLSTLWFFISVWGESSKALCKIRSSLRNFLWAGKDQRACTRVAWNVCCKKKIEGGLSLVDPELAKINMLCKWIVYALEPGKANLQIMLRYRLE